MVRRGGAGAGLRGDGNFRAASVAAPTVTATPVDGGWEINGTIGYCSGIPYSNWYMGQAIMPGETPTGEPRMMLFIAPESEWEMLNDWGDQLGPEGQRLAQHPLRRRAGSRRTSRSRTRA